MRTGPASKASFCSYIKIMKRSVQRSMNCILPIQTHIPDGVQALSRNVDNIPVGKGYVRKSLGLALAVHRRRCWSGIDANIYVNNRCRFFFLKASCKLSASARAWAPREARKRTMPFQRF